MASLQSSDKEGFTVPDARPVVFDPEPGSGAAARLVPPPPPPLWRPALGWLCVVGIPIMTCASTEYGQYMETRMTDKYSKGYVVAWLNHTVLIVFLLPWALIVISEKGCSCSALWHAMVAPYGSVSRFIGVTFWLGFQYIAFNYAYWSWLPLVSTSSAMTINQSQCIFVFVFSVLVLKEPFSAVRLVLCLLCFSGVLVLAYGDAKTEDSSDSSDGKQGTWQGDLMLLFPSACNALYAVEWKRLVPGGEMRDSLVGLGSLAVWHLVLYSWGIPLTQYLGWDGPGGIMPVGDQWGALFANAGIAACFNFFFMMGSTLVGPVPIIVGGAVAMPLTYLFDVFVRGLEFSAISLLGALVVFFAFILLNVVERREANALRSANAAGVREALLPSGSAAR